jgi:multidrug efflux pump subunit AcrA (membrane-fusion protein)
VEEATAEAEKYEARSEKLAPLVAEARTIVEQARAAEAAEVAAAAEAAEAEAAVQAVAQAVAAAERLQLEERLAALALEVQQVQARLGVIPPAPAPHPDAEETMCVVCFDAPKQYAMLPCLHMCACEACAQQLLQLHRRCPVCREPIERVGQVFT